MKTTSMQRRLGPCAGPQTLRHPVQTKILYPRPSVLAQCSHLRANALHSTSQWPCKLASGPMLSRDTHHLTRRRRIVCSSASAMVQDPADVIPDGADSDEEEGKPAETPVLVVGAGPIGILTAMYLARRGYTVQIVEKNADPAESDLLIPECDQPLILSSRCLLAFEELGATGLLQGLAAVSMRGRWWVAGAPADVVASPAPPTSTDSASATSGGSTSSTSRAVFEQFPGWDQRYTRRVLVSRWQLVHALLQEADRLYGNKISLYYKSEFIKVEWDQKLALVRTQDPSTVQARQAQSDMPLGASQLDTPADEVWVPYGLLVGADGAESTVRRVAERRKPKITDFDISRPSQDTRQWKAFDSLAQVPRSGEVVPGMSGHKAREFEYVYQAAGAPTLRLWVPAEGFVRGTITGVDRWESKALEAVLKQAYGSSLPDEWLQQILAQTCSANSPAPQVSPSSVQCSQFHGPRLVLVGDAAHAMTSEYDQGISCAVEGVRLLNIALKSTKDNLDKALRLFSEVRTEDVHSVQQLEFFQRSAKPGLSFGDPVHRLAGWLGALVWQSTLVMMGLVRTWFPHRFPVTYISDRLWDARRGYSDLLKVVLRFAAVPIVLAVVSVVILARAALLATGRLT